MEYLVSINHLKRFQVAKLDKWKMDKGNTHRKHMDYYYRQFYGHQHLLLNLAKLLNLRSLVNFGGLHLLNIITHY